jgi:acetolactate synthase-1/3 small subunit
MLMKVSAKTELARAEVNRNVEIFRAQIVDVNAKSYTIQIAGVSDKLDAFSASMAEHTEIMESSRTGVCGLSRGDKALRA